MAVKMLAKVRASNGPDAKYVAGKVVDSDSLPQLLGTLILGSWDNSLWSDSCSIRSLTDMDCLGRSVHLAPSRAYRGGRDGEALADKARHTAFRNREAGLAQIVERRLAYKTAQQPTASFSCPSLQKTFLFLISRKVQARSVIGICWTMRRNFSKNSIFAE